MFKSTAAQQEQDDEENKYVAPEIPLDQVHALIYSSKAEHRYLLIYEDKDHPLSPHQLVKIIMQQINNDIQKFRKKLQEEVKAKRKKML